MNVVAYIDGRGSGAFDRKPEAGAGSARPNRRAASRLSRALRALRRRCLGLHDAVGRLSGWRAIHDEGEGVWDFHDPLGRIGVSLPLDARPSSAVVDFVALIWSVGHAEGRRAHRDRHWTEAARAPAA